MKTYTKRYETFGSFDKEINKEIEKGATIKAVHPVTLTFMGNTTAPGVLVEFNIPEQFYICAEHNHSHQRIHDAKERTSANYCSKCLDWYEPLSA